MSVPTSAPVRTDVRPADTPKRLQRSRAKGWRMPDGAIYVGRPTRWGNPWRAGQDHPWFPAGSRLMTRQDAVDFYEKWLDGPNGIVALASLGDLRGKDLVCWCRVDDPCHADVLIRRANA